MDKFKVKRSVKFNLNCDYMLECTYTNIDDVLDDYPDSVKDEMRDILTDVTICTLTDGKTFLDDVRAGKIADDNDNLLIDIIVDGYLSNLGLSESGFNQGRFLVDGNLFEDLCQSHDILVNWRR